MQGAAVTLMTGTGAEAVVAVSDRASRRIEEIQFDLGEGPGRDAFHEACQVLVDDVEEGFTRWPIYVPAVRAAGVGAVFAFPLRLGASRLGVLTFYGARPRVLEPAETAACLVLADTATQLLLDGGPPGKDGTRPGIPSLLRVRSEVYQAQGIVMVDLGIGLADALARMRAHAYATDTELDVLAREVIAGTTRLDPGDGP